LTMSVQLMAMRYLLGSYAALKTNDVILSKVAHAELVKVIADGLRGTPEGIGNRGNLIQAVQETFWPDPGNNDSCVFELIESIAEQAYGFDVDGVFIQHLTPTELLPYRRHFPLSLLQAFALVKKYPKAKGLDQAEFQRPKQSETLCFKKRCLTDSHVHMGAAIPLETLITRAAIEAVKTQQERKKKAFGNICVTETLISLDILLLACGLALYMLDQFLNSASLSSQQFDTFTGEQQWPSWVKKLVQSVQFWPKTLSYRLSSQYRISHLKEWFSSGTILKESSRSLTQLGALDGINEFWMKALRYQATHGDTAFDSLLLGVIRTYSMIYQWAIPDRAGFTAFSDDSFSRYRYLRSAAIFPKNHTALAIEAMHRDPFLKRVALRVGFDRNIRLKSKELCKAMKGFSEAYQKHQKKFKENERLDISFPLVFMRDLGESRVVAESGTHLSRFQFGTLWSNAITAAELFSAAPDVKFLSGVLDVAGHEDKAPNWIFSLLYKEFVDRAMPQSQRNPGPRMKYTVHAGEESRTPLQGLRRVNEVLEHFPEGTQIGHGCALVRTPGQVDFYDIPPHELLDDLVWAWNIVPVGTTSLKEDLRSAALKLAERIYENDNITLEQLHKAYEYRFNREMLSEIGLLKRDLSSGDTQTPIFQFNGSVRLDIDHTHRVSRELLCKFLYENFNHMERRITPNQCEYDTKLIDLAYKEIQPIIIDKLKQEGTAIQICPTSNVIISGLTSYEQHPVFELNPASGNPLEIPVNVNTDDPGLFGVTLSEEYEALASASKASCKIALVRRNWLEKLQDQSDLGFLGHSGVDISSILRGLDSATYVVYE
jgi:Adenosine deaminase